MFQQSINLNKIFYIYNIINIIISKVFNKIRISVNMTKSCPSCKVDIKDGYMQCPNCLKIIPKDSIVCPNCHISLIEEEPTEILSGKYIFIISLVLALGMVYLEGQSFFSLRFYIELIIILIIFFSAMNWFINNKI